MKNKKIKRTPVKKSVIKRTPVKGPLLLSKKEPSDNKEEYLKTLAQSKQRVDKEFISKISSEVGFIQNLTETNLEPTRLYEYQQSIMSDKSKYRHIDKSRQVGMSYGFACEGYAKSQLLDIYTGIFISYNQDEANEKVVYARALHDSVPFKFKKKLVIDRVTALEWESMVRDGRKTRTRLISHPQREPRGKGFNTDVYLDEIAHYQWPQKVYIAAVPIITRGFGQLAMASSPLGQSGLHYEIGHNVQDYNMYSRHRIYWWNNPDFLSDDALRHPLNEIEELARDMETYDRVMEFGNDSVRQAYQSMLAEYFQQEYELKAIDESSSYFSMDLIKQCTFEALKGFQHLEDGDIYGDNPVSIDPVFPGFNFHTYESIEELSHAIAIGKVGKRFVAGYDVGRKEDASEVYVLEEVPNLDYLQVLRLGISMKRMTFRKQFDMICKLFQHVPILKMKIDSTGIGRNIAEDLQSKFHSRIEDINFTNENKGEMAANLKLRMEDQAIAYPSERDLIRQIHSIKRKVSETSVIKFEIPESERRSHHGDKFWALALGSSAGQPAQMHKVVLLSTNIRKIAPNDRIIKLPPNRIFKRDTVIEGVNYKKIEMPPRVASEFAVDSLISNI